MWQGPSPKIAWILVLAVHGEAARAALLQASELLVAEVPAARTLIEVAADGAGVADLRRADFGRRLGTSAGYILRASAWAASSASVTAAPIRSPPSGVLRDRAIEILDVDEALGLGDVVLHQRRAGPCRRRAAARVPRSGPSAATASFSFAALT